jgi:hypothetical protein
MADYEAITVVLGRKLKHEVEKWNVDHPRNKIKYAPICREVIQNALNEKKAFEGQRVK